MISRLEMINNSRATADKLRSVSNYSDALALAREVKQSDDMNLPTHYLASHIYNTARRVQSGEAPRWDGHMFIGVSMYGGVFPAFGRQTLTAR